MGDNSNAALPKNKHVKTGCWQLRLSSTPNAASARKSKRFFSGQKGTHLQTMCDFGDWDSFWSKKSINHSIGVFPKRMILEVFWLVVYLPLWKIMEFVNGKDDIPWDFPRDFPNVSGWWFQPLWKILVSWDHYSQYMENKKCSKAPTSFFLKFCHKSSTLRHCDVIKNPPPMAYVFWGEALWKPLALLKLWRMAHRNRWKKSMNHADSP